jgi:quercetin dioxygenase-like cupin family protein
MTNYMTTKQLVWLVLTAAAASASAGLALASPGSGVLSATVVARAGFPDQVDLKFKVADGKMQVLHVPDAQETVIQSIVLGPNGLTGWHSHPGPTVVLVKAGELTVYAGDDSGCNGRTYSAGQAFVDSGQGHVHLARNPSPDQNTELWVTYFDVPSDGTFRIDVPDPGMCQF